MTPCWTAASGASSRLIWLSTTGRVGRDHPGQEVQLGDTILVFGRARTIVEVEPYRHPVIKTPARIVRWPGQAHALDPMVIFDGDPVELVARR